MFIRGYLRASTQDQNAERSRDQLTGFAAEQGQVIASFLMLTPEIFFLLRLSTDCTGCRRLIGSSLEERLVQRAFGLLQLTCLPVMPLYIPTKLMILLPECLMPSMP